jgi:uncharacterized membrane protein
LGPVLLGLAVARLGVDHGVIPTLARFELDAAPVRGLRFIGRHSLAYYLAHQPIMLSILYVFLSVIGRT